MERSLKCVVIDDEPLARALICGYIANTPSLLLEGSYQSAVESMKRIMSGDIDIVFLDINMPMLSGIEFAAVVPARTRIIYITAYESYAVEGFKVNALDYLLKPVNYSDFMRSVGKAIEWFRMVDAGESSAVASLCDCVNLRSEGRLIRLRLDSILYIEAKGDRVMIFRRDGDPLNPLISLSELERLLPAEDFIRVHRSFIVRLSGVEIVERSRIVYGKTYVPVSDSRREEFFARIGK